MTASTGSAYPASVEDLLPLVRTRMAELGKLPSRNQIMREFKIGGPKAAAIRERLADTADESETRDSVDTTKQVRALHSVPEIEPNAEAGMADETPEPVADQRPDDQPTTEDFAQVKQDVDPGTPVPAERPSAAESATTDMAEPSPTRRVRRWPVVLLALPAFVAIWGGWVGLGRMTGFGPIQLLPGIWDELVVNSAITLPIGVEAYAAFAMSVWLSGRTRSARTRRFAMWSALGSLALGMAGQVAYHLMSAAGITTAPWLITTFVACLPVVVLGCGAALLHLMHEEGN
ncbi:ABC transporter permease [Kibdelosporangium philippinense]|uniref:ABC transporter permease n=1 Tax=Kibdelosporangium philippinense TaxID=211113 RepID=A0ABS8ZNP3_9PSEU|nr:ABC transporter permease [Kibdelosporangium philippinense]MCE7009335.1 ABC transporter permease [Kibdelosporangium philippinense]